MWGPSCLNVTFLLLCRDSFLWPTCFLLFTWISDTHVGLWDLDLGGFICRFVCSPTVETVLQLAMVMYVVNDRAWGHNLHHRRLPTEASGTHKGWNMWLPQWSRFRPYDTASSTWRGLTTPTWCLKSSPGSRRLSAAAWRYFLWRPSDFHPKGVIPCVCFSALFWG